MSLSDYRFNASCLPTTLSSSLGTVARDEHLYVDALAGVVHVEQIKQIAPGSCPLNDFRLIVCWSLLHMVNQQKWHVVIIGKEPGVYSSWYVPCPPQRRDGSARLDENEWLVFNA